MKLFTRSLLPDELADGYRGSIRFMNFLRDASETTAKLNTVARNENGSSISHEQSFVTHAAQLSGIGISDVVLRHTLWQFTTALSAVRPAEVTAAYVDTQAGRTAVMRRARQDAWLCSQCVKEDLAFWGESYWRRSHQLPGVLRCSKHRTPLSRTPAAATSDGAPDHSACRATRVCQSLVNSLDNYPAVATFVEFCAALLESGRAFNQELCRQTLLRQVQTCFTANNPREIARTVNQLIAKEFPMAWLSEVAHKGQWREGQGLSAVDAFFRPYGTKTATQTLALVAAAVYDKAADALNALLLAHRAASSCDGLGARSAALT